MSAWRTWQNGKWRLEAIAPAEASIVNEAFSYFDSERLAPEFLRHRSFSWDWAESEPDDVPTDLYDRWTDQTYVLEVYYRVGEGGLSAQGAHQAILEDRDDINTTLRDPGLWDGYDDDNPSASTGLMNRVRVAEEIERTEGVWIYRSQWRCKVQEVES